MYMKARHTLHMVISLFYTFAIVRVYVHARVGNFRVLSNT